MIQYLEGEIWRDIPGYEGLYQISNHGRVVRGTWLLAEAIASGRRDHIRIMKQSNSNHGKRWTVGLCMKGKTRRFQVHRLVLESFVGPCPDGLECRHLDGDHNNNRLENLEWGTRLENAQDRIQHGTHGRGEKSAAAKLTEKQVREIRADPRGARRLARVYGVSMVAIHYIKTRKTWKHVD